MKRFYTELTAGIFLLIGAACLAWLSIHVGGLNLGGADTYEVYATFTDVGALREGGDVVIAGVNIGSVRTIRFDHEKYAGEVVLAVSEDIKLPVGTIAAIKTRGLIGEQYVALSPGGGAEDIEPGGRIRDTQSHISLLDLAVKYGLGDIGGGDDDAPSDDTKGDKTDNDLDDMGTI